MPARPEIDREWLCDCSLIRCPRTGEHITDIGLRMRQSLGDIIIECEESITRSPEQTWAAVATGTKPPADEGVKRSTGSGDDDAGTESLIRPTRDVFMVQRVIHRNDRAMVVRFEMTRGQNLPWSTCHSSLRVESNGVDESRVVLICVVTPTDDQISATVVLRGLVTFWLNSLKARLERAVAH